MDKRLTLSALNPGEIHRAKTVQSFAGGKSTHVAMVLKALGAEPHWIGMCGGAAGEQVVAGLRALGIAPHPVPVEGQTRNNLEIIEDSGPVTEIREAGEPVTSGEVAAFEMQCGKLFEQYAGKATVIFSGSLPPAAPNNLYASLIAAARSFGCRTLLDASGEPLAAALAAGPDLVKPNRDEAAALLHSPLTSNRASAEAANRILKLGARSVALSLGSAGMLYASSEDSPLLFAPAVSIKVRSTVGCGDAALAGFAYSLASGALPEEAIRLATACATANCLAESPGAVRREVIDQFHAQIRVEAFSAGP